MKHLICEIFYEKLRSLDYFMSMPRKDLYLATNQYNSIHRLIQTVYITTVSCSHLLRHCFSTRQKYIAMSHSQTQTNIYRTHENKFENKMRREGNRFIKFLMVNHHN